PFRRGDDAVLGGHGGPVPDSAPGAALVLLLARTVSGQDGALATVAQSAGVGFLCHRGLSACLAAVLVCGPAAGPRQHARSCARPPDTGAVRACRARLARRGAPLETASDRLSAGRRHGRTARGLGAQRRIARLCDRQHPRLSLDDLSALLRRRCPVLWLR